MARVALRASRKEWTTPQTGWPFTIQETGAAYSPGTETSTSSDGLCPEVNRRLGPHVQDQGKNLDDQAPSLGTQQV